MNKIFLFLKQLFCKHNYDYLGIMTYGYAGFETQYRVKQYECLKCGKLSEIVIFE